MRHTTSLLAVGLAIALVATAAHAQLKKSVAKTGGVDSSVIGAPVMDRVNKGADFQLICRGGTQLRVFGLSLSEGGTLQVVFNRSTQPPDRTGRNLQPGQCSPADFQLRVFDPVHIWNTIRVAADAGEDERWSGLQNIQEYLKDPNHYWSFTVFSAGYMGWDYLQARDSRYWKPEFYKGPVPSTTHQSTATPAAMVDRSSTTVQETSSRFGGLGAHTEGHAGIPALPSPAAPAAPPLAVPAPALPAVFSPPLLQDGEQLWACADAAAGEADAQACSGEQSAQAYCVLRGAQSGPDVRIADAQPGIPVRAVNGDVCQNANACRVVSELQCDH